jgi:peptide/nickel transport system substrate-binding protein
MTAFRSLISRTALSVALALTATFGCYADAVADDLTMGIAIEPDTIDPHYHWNGGNLAFSLQVFEPLVWLADDGSIQPVLAQSWKILDDETWEFDLRPGVKFQDGAPLTSADVAFSYQRALDMKQSPNSFAPYLKDIKSVDTSDPAKVIIHTNGPAPILPNLLSRVGIVSAKTGAEATTENYNNGKVAFGTGPYKFVSWTRGDSVTLKRNDGYWGAKPQWDNVRLRYIPNPASRLAALRSGTVDVIDSVPLDDIDTIKKDKAFSVQSSPSSNVIGIQVDMAQRKPPFITGPNGEALDVNPLTDLRVRQAIAMSINRQAIKDRIMNGHAEVADQIMARDQYGYDPDLKPIAYNPETAKKLLAEAGYPNGFKMALQCQGERYPKAPNICQALAQMFARIGIITDPQPLVQTMFVPRANKHEFSLFNIFFIVDAGEPTVPFMQIFATPGSGPKGAGQTNRGQFHDPNFDKVILEANRTVDRDKRLALLKQATGLVFDQVGMIALLRPLNVVAMKASLSHVRITGDAVFAADIQAGKAK